MSGSPKNIRNGASAAEAARIFAMAPESLKVAATTLAGLLAAIPKEELVADIVIGFQTFISYGTTSTRVLEDDIDTYVQSQVRELVGATSGAPLFKLTQFQNGNAKTLLMTYFGITRAQPALGSTSNVSLTQALQVFRDNLLEYKVTGNASYKAASDGAKSWLDQYLASLDLQVTKGADAISAQVSSYTTANQEMTRTQDDFRRVKADGPKAENAYLTLKKQTDQQTLVPDTTGFYVKVGIAAALGVGAVVLSLV